MQFFNKKEAVNTTSSANDYVIEIAQYEALPDRLYFHIISGYFLLKFFLALLKVFEQGQLWR